MQPVLQATSLLSIPQATGPTPILQATGPTSNRSATSDTGNRSSSNTTGNRFYRQPVCYWYTSTCVCMYICIYIRIYIHTYIWVLHVMYVCLYLCMCVCMYAFWHVTNVIADSNRHLHNHPAGYALLLNESKQKGTESWEASPPKCPSESGRGTKWASSHLDEIYIFIYTLMYKVAYVEFWHWGCTNCFWVSFIYETFKIHIHVGAG